MNGDTVLSCLGAGDHDVNIMHARILTRVTGRIKGIRTVIDATPIARNQAVRGDHGSPARAVVGLEVEKVGEPGADRGERCIVGVPCAGHHSLA